MSGPNGGRLMHNFPNWPSGYGPVSKLFYNNGSPVASTIYVLKNNIIANYNDFDVILTPAKTSHTYNGVKLSGGSAYGTSFSTGEGNVTNMWVDTSSLFPVNWNYRLKTPINGTTIARFTRDFYNVPITGTTMQGIAQPDPVNRLRVLWRFN